MPLHYNSFASRRVSDKVYLKNIRRFELLTPYRGSQFACMFLRWCKRYASASALQQRERHRTRSIHVGKSDPHMPYPMKRLRNNRSRTIHLREQHKSPRCNRGVGFPHRDPRRCRIADQNSPMGSRTGRLCCCSMMLQECKCRRSCILESNLYLSTSFGNVLV